ncbi:hypothetical protein NHQ30_004067 [Ciborinia camelliae]|nr:hypothetical protein NHQ30_004067 [Ciborinia camelliae]
MGVIANRTIKRGTPLFAYPTIGIYHNDAFPKAQNTSSKFPDHTPLFTLAATQLPRSTSSLLFSLASHESDCQAHDGSGVIGRLNTNTFGEEFFGSEHSVVVPETARLNHDCRPNANYYFNLKTLTHYTVAARTIAEGEEITITYTDPLTPHFPRRAAIRRSWGFSCTCSLCLSSPSLRSNTNHRIKTIISLQETLSYDKLSHFPPPNYISKALNLIELYKMEGLESHIGDGYRSAALAYATAGKEWESKRYAEWAVESMLVSEGPGNSEVREMMGMARKEEGVRAHWSWKKGIVEGKKCACGNGHAGDIE